MERRLEERVVSRLDKHTIIYHTIYVLFGAVHSKDFFPWVYFWVCGWLHSEGLIVNRGRSQHKQDSILENLELSSTPTRVWVWSYTNPKSLVPVNVPAAQRYTAFVSRTGQIGVAGIGKHRCATTWNPRPRNVIDPFNAHDFLHRITGSSQSKLPSYRGESSWASTVQSIFQGAVADAEWTERRHVTSLLWYWYNAPRFAYCNDPAQWISHLPTRAAVKLNLE